MSDSSQPYRLWPARLPCPSPSPGACSNSCLLSWWCLPTILSSVINRMVNKYLVAQMVKNLPAMWETQVWSLGWEDLLEKEMATHFNILAWRIPWTEESVEILSVGSQRAGHNWANNPHTQCHYSVTRYNKRKLQLQLEQIQVRVPHCIYRNVVTCSQGQSPWEIGSESHEQHNCGDDFQESLPEREG